jgi:hypothetical protein
MLLDDKVPWMIVAVLPIATAGRSFGIGKAEPKSGNRACENKFIITALLGLLSVICLSPMAASIAIVETVILIIVTRLGTSPPDA